ncbi:hypothetical protein D3C86_2153010 [compost metagenome]
MGGMALTPGSPTVPGKNGARDQSDHASGVASDGAHAACLTILKLTPLMLFLEFVAFYSAFFKQHEL